MAAERMPHDRTSLLGYALAGLVRLSTRFPWTTLLVCAAGIAGSLYLGATQLGYHTSRVALLNRDSEFNRRWLAYVDEFSDKEDVVVVVQGDQAPAISAALDELAAEVGRQPKLFQAVFHKVDLERLRAKGLHFVPPEQLAVIEGFLQEAEPILNNGWALLNPGTMAAALAVQVQNLPPAEAQRAMASGQAKLGAMADALAVSLATPGAYRSPWPDLSGFSSALGAMQSRYLFSRNGKMGFLVLQLTDERPGSQDFVRYTENIDTLRRLIAQVKPRHPEVQIGLTGLPVMENDEMRCSQSSMTVITGLSLLAVMVVLVAGFGGLRHSILVMIVLTIGMLWSLGYSALAVGHLNILSSAFGTILIGLGNDYGAYFVARYLQLRVARQCSLEEAMIETAATVGPGITVGALSTATAFFMAGLTEFTGIKELGLIAGGGIVLCLLATFTALPALVHLCDRNRPLGELPAPLSFEGWIRPAMRYPVSVLALTLAGTVILAGWANWGNFDNNLLNMQPEGLESVELERKLLAETDESAWYALSIARSPEEALERKAAFLQLPSVRRVDEIASMLPLDAGRKQPVIQRIASRLQRLPQRAPQIPLSSREQLLQVFQQAAPMMAGMPQAEAFQQRAAALARTLQALPDAEYYARLSAFQQRMASELLGQLHLLRSLASPDPPALGDLPPGLVRRFVGKSGTHLLRVYGKGDIWDPAVSKQFVEEVRSIDPDTTGNPLQVHEATLQMKRSYEQTTRYGLATILPLVFLNFVSIRCTLLAILPLVLSLVQMYGLMGLLGIPHNPANLIALPLMLGMGMDNGIHVVHDYLGQRGGYRMSSSTALAVVVNTLTTMTGFAVLLLADHRGLQSLGRVLTLGLTCMLFNSILGLPAILSLMGRRRAQAELPESAERPAPEPVPEPDRHTIRRRPNPAAAAYRRSDAARRAA